MASDYKAKVDLLHPLTTLHWQQHHSWNNYKPTGCAVLHDRVAILLLAKDWWSHDVVYTFPFDLQSFTTTKLPYKHMSLTTYKSQFVAVGGWDPFTGYPIDLVFTSDTGDKWKQTLPCMRTKRYKVSSVGTTSPEVLVVSSGPHLGYTKLYDIEVLIDNNWHFVPLKRGIVMTSILHQDEILFRDEWNASIHSCSIASLIASCTSTSTHIPKWRIIEGLCTWDTLVSSSTGLFKINGNGSVKYYNNMTQSYVKVSTVGHVRHSSYTCASTLPTGDIIVARNDGIYKLKVSGKLPAYTDVDKKSMVVKHSPKKMTLDVEHYLSYSQNIEFILLARSSQGYNAATIYLERPIIEDANTDNTGTVLDSNAVVGSFAGAQVALIKADHTDNIKEVLTNAISHFPKAQHVISIGISKTIYREDVKLADVLISTGVTSVQHCDISGDEPETCVTLNGNYIELHGLLQQIFNIDTKVEKDFKVDAVRTASYYACNILESIGDTSMPKNSATKIDSPNLALPVHFCAIGCDTDGTQLIQLRDEGKIKDFVLIKSAVAYNSTTDSNDEWKFTGAMAAVHCIQQKMASYMYHKNSVDRYLSALESQEDDILDVMVAKLIFVGPSLQGKSVTRQRLTKKFKNIKSKQDRDCSNTGVSEQSTVMVCKKDFVRVTAMADSDDNWNVVDIEDEFLLCMNMSKIGTKARPQFQVLSQSIPAAVLKSTPVDVSKLKSTKKESVVLEREEPKLPQEKMTPVPIASKLQPVPAVGVVWTDQMIRAPLEIRKHYSLENLKLKLDNGNLIYMQDTGGQPELMECLPALTIGPALYLLFCNLNSSLDECYQIGYRGSDGIVLPGKSDFTVKETMLTALASIASMSCSSYSADFLEREKNKVACVYVVGTHKDLVNNDAVDKYECKLQEHLKATSFYQEGIIKWWHKGDFSSENSISQNMEERLIYPIDNMHGDDEEMRCLRKSILDRLHTIHGKKKIPSQWLLFSIILRKNKENFIKLKSCFELGAKLNMEEEDVKSVLHFLHYNLGICMYFYNVPALEDIVITNTQGVFKRLTVLIEAAQKTSEVDKVARERFRETGQFSVAKFKVIGDDILPLETLVLILSHLNIIAPIQSSSGSGDAYFMPCILRNASEKDLEEYQLIGIPNVIPALFVYYTCGFVPLGIFPAMIANLFHQINEKDSKIIDLKSKTLKRNFVQFQYGVDRDIVAITYKPQYIKVQISRQHNQCRHELHTVCLGIRNLVKNTMKSVTSHMLQSLYTLASSEKQYKDNFESYQFAFECYKHPESKHFCVVSNKEEDPIHMDCAEGESVRMKPLHLLWYGKKLNTKEYPESKKDGHPFSVFLSVYPDLVLSVTPCVLTVADHCVSRGLISGDTYDQIVKRGDWIDTDKARCLLNNVRTVLSATPQDLEEFIFVLFQVEDCKFIAEKIRQQLQ